MGKQLISNVQLFDGESKNLYPAEVLISGNRIETVAKVPEKLPRDGGRCPGWRRGDPDAGYGQLPCSPNLLQHG